MSKTLQNNGIRPCPSCGRLTSVDSKSCIKCGWLLSEGLSVGLAEKPSSNMQLIEETELQLKQAS